MAAARGSKARRGQRDAARAGRLRESAFPAAGRSLKTGYLRATGIRSTGKRGRPVRSSSEFAQRDPAGQAPAWRRAGLSERALALLAIAALTLISRAWVFGDPLIHVDEQFYLLVGHRMVAGDLPYVDIFDVKPIGLFLIYAFADLVFPDSITGYQVLAALSVALTAFILFGAARRVASFAAALGGACAYIAWLTVFEGIGGQSPVFYNLPMAAGAALLLRAIGRADARYLSRRGAAIMLLAGIAIQIKYPAVFEGVFFGLALLWIGHRRGRRFGRLAADAALWVGCALAPSLAALLTYAALGHAGPFIQDNFVSIFGRQTDGGQSLMAFVRLAEQMLALSPFWLCAAITVRRVRSPGLAGRPEVVGMLAWAGAALIGYLPAGTWSEHFVLPLLSPLSLLGAVACDGVANRKGAIARLVGIGLIAGFGRSACEVATEGNARDAQRIANLVTPYLHDGGCLYVVNAPPSLYLLTHSCLLTRYAFPSHLLSQKYAPTLGSDATAEMRRLLRRKPAVIVMGRPYANPNRVNQRLLDAELRLHYRQLTAAHVGVRPLAIWVRQPELRALPSAPAAAPSSSKAG